MALPLFDPRATLARFAEAVLFAGEGEASAGQTAEELLRFLSLYRSHRKWRIHAVIAALELAPLAAGRKPFGMMSAAERRAFVLSRLATDDGLWGKLAMGRQLVLLAFYGVGRSDARVGFVRAGERPSVRSRLRRAPGPGVR